MANFVVRSATKKDFPAIRALIHAVSINPTGLDWRHFLVAITPDNSLLGCGQIKEHFDGSRELASIAVMEKARRQGVARTIIQTLLVRETRRPIYLICRAEMESFYIQFGFRTIGQNEMPRYFQRIARVERIFNARAKAKDRLRVMRL